MIVEHNSGASSSPLVITRDKDVAAVDVQNRVTGDRRSAKSERRDHGLEAGDRLRHGGGAVPKRGSTTAFSVTIRTT